MSTKMNATPVLIEEVDPNTVESWKVYIGKEIETCYNWGDAHGYLLDALKFWYGYYSVQIEDAVERGLTWTVQEYEQTVKQYGEWIDFLKRIEDIPQEVNFIGANRKLSVIPKREQSNG